MREAGANVIDTEPKSKPQKSEVDELQSQVSKLESDLKDANCRVSTFSIICYTLTKPCSHKVATMAS